MTADKSEDLGYGKEAETGCCPKCAKHYGENWVVGLAHVGK